MKKQTETDLQKLERNLHAHLQMIFKGADVPFEWTGDAKRALKGVPTDIAVRANGILYTGHVYVDEDELLDISLTRIERRGSRLRMT